MNDQPTSSSPKAEDDDRDMFADVSPEVKQIHELMFPVSYEVIYPETQAEEGFPIAKSIVALINQARIDEIETQDRHLFDHEPYFTSVNEVMVYNRDRKQELRAQLSDTPKEEL